MQDHNQTLAPSPEKQLVSSGNRVLTIDELSPQRRLALLLPPGVSQAKLRHRNDKVMPAAKLIVHSTWVDGTFGFGSRGFDRAIAYTFAIEQKMQDQAMSLAESLGWFEVDWSGKVVTEINLLKTIYDQPSDARQKRLNLGAASSDLVIEEVFVHLGSLRRLLPRRLMGHPNVHFSHKLLFIAERAGSGLESRVFQFRLTSLGRTLGLDRNSIRAGANFLARFVGETPCSRDGVVYFPVPDCLYSRTEIELFERVQCLEFSSDDRGVTERVSSVDGKGVSSTLPLTNGELRQRSDTGTVDGDVVSSTVLPQVLMEPPPHERKRSREGLSINAFGALVPHDHDMINDHDMTSGSGDDADRVLALERLVLSYADRIDLTETRRYVVRGWALAVATNLLLDRSGEAFSVSVEEFEAVFDAAVAAAAKTRTAGAYITHSLSSGRSVDWRVESERVSHAIGIEFGRDMRLNVGGEPPPPPAQPTTAKSRAPRGGDQLDQLEQTRDALIRQFKKLGVPHVEAVARADKELLTKASYPDAP